MKTAKDSVTLYYTCTSTFIIITIAFPIEKEKQLIHCVEYMYMYLLSMENIIVACFFCNTINQSLNPLTSPTRWWWVLSPSGSIPAGGSRRRTGQGLQVTQKCRSLGFLLATSGMASPCFVTCCYVKYARINSCMSPL